MNNFDKLVTVGASWSWGSELPEDRRLSLRFDSLLASKLNLPSVNISREAASNFCLKWHWINWLDSNPDCNRPLVVVQVTLPNRALIWNNSADYFQESPNRLVSEQMVNRNWKNTPTGGGFIRATGNQIDFPDAIKEKCVANFYRFNYDDKMGEIYTIWEIKLLDSIIKEFGGQAIFWVDEWTYNVNLPWAQSLLKNCMLVNNLAPLCDKPEYFKGNYGHPNELGHKCISDKLYHAIHSDFRLVDQ